MSWLLRHPRLVDVVLVAVLIPASALEVGLRSSFEDLACDCRDVWRTATEVQEFMLTSADPTAVLEA